MPKGQKQTMKSKGFRIAWIVYAIASMLFVMILLNHLISSGMDNVSEKVTLNGKWDVSINDTVYEAVTLESFRFQPVDKDDVVVLTTVLPNEWELREPALCMTIAQTVVDMYVDGVHIYSYGHERYENKDTVGNGIQFIDFDNDYKGKELQIVLIATEDNAFSSIKSIWLGDWQDTYRFVLTENRLPLLLGVFLIVFGVVVTSLLIFAVVFETRYLDVLSISIFSICIGIWTLCYNNVLVIFSLPVHMITLIENMALLLAPLPILGHMYVYVKALESKSIMTFYRILAIAQIFSTIVTIILHAFDVIHSAESIMFHYFIYIIFIFFFGFLLLKSAKRNKKHKKIYYIGMGIVLVCILYELITYAMGRYWGNRLLEMKGVSAFGIIVFIAVLLLDLYQDVMLKQMAEKEREILIKRAYTDDLTQIYNRAFCSDYMTNLQTAGKNHFTIISFDINNLKLTNDTYGHVAGDSLIKRAAHLLEKVFAGEGTIGRMGGDEFIVILPSCDRSKIKRLIAEFESNIQKENEKSESAQLSVAYGYVCSDEFADASVEMVYHEADSRMYRHKRDMKK